MSYTGLRVFTPLLDGAVFVADVSDQVSGYRRSIRRNGGYWLGDFTLNDEPNNLAKFFYERLGCHFVETAGGYTTWEGLIYEMEFTLNGVTRRRSLDTLANYVKTTYLDTAGVAQESAAAVNDESIARYGRKEEMLLLDGFEQAAAEARRDTYLRENGWTWPRVVGMGLGRSDIQLTIALCGYVHTANWRYESVGDGTTGNLSDWLKAIIETDCEFLQVGSITENTMQVRKETNTPQRAWDVLNELLDLGDTAGNPYRLYVDNQRRVTYEPLSKEPLYWLRGGMLYNSAGGSGAANPWLLKPGVIRDTSYPIRRKELGAWLDDARDCLIDEIELGDSGITLKTDEFEEGDLLAAQQDYAAMLENEAGGGGTGGIGSGSIGGGGVSKKPGLNWKRKIGLTPGTDEWEKASKASWEDKQAQISGWKKKRKKKG